MLLFSPFADYTNPKKSSYGIVGNEKEIRPD
jgi:hypothetical protein